MSYIIIGRKIENNEDFFILSDDEVDMRFEYKRLLGKVHYTEVYLGDRIALHLPNSIKPDGV